jgi:hypothetical protein
VSVSVIIIAIWHIWYSQSKNISELKKCIYLLNQRLLILESIYSPSKSAIQKDCKQIEPSTIEEFGSNPKNKF